jgi:hypothetical protein
VALPLFAIGMVVFIGMAGLALDMGHVYLNKTRLQNALDAAALSGAKVLNDTHDEDLAKDAARLTFGKFDIAGAGLVPTVEVCTDPSCTNLPPTDPRYYLRANVNAFSMPVWLAHVLPGVGNTLSIGGSAVAGPVPIGPKRDVVPLSVCGDPEAPYFGYPPDAKKEYQFKGPLSGKACEYGPGNFQILELDCGSGADCVRKELSGEYSGSIEGNSTFTEPGNKVGPVAQGLNTRFGIYQGGRSPSNAPPDVVTDTDYDASGNYFWYDDYLDELRPQDGPPYPNGGVPGRRIVAVPIIKCQCPFNGRTKVKVLGYGCFFLTRPADHTGKQIVYGQSIGRCEADGSVAQSPSATGSGFNLYKIVLYKDPTSPDS